MAEVHGDQFEQICRAIEKYRCPDYRTRRQLHETRVLIVRGVRGSGKTHLLHVLRQRDTPTPEIWVCPRYYDPAFPFAEYLLTEFVRTLLSPEEAEAPVRLRWSARELTRRLVGESIAALSPAEWLEWTRPSHAGPLFSPRPQRRWADWESLLDDLAASTSSTALAEICARHGLSATAASALVITRSGTTMTASTSAGSWIARRPARWSMPVCLQPRAPRRCRIVRAEDKRPVRQSRLGCHLQPRGHYQLEITVDGKSDEPRSVSLVAGPLRRANDQEQRLSQDGRTITRYDLQFARDDDIPRLPGCWWSRREPLVARLEYGDGRDDGEHTLWLVVTPRRVWALLALISSAVLYGLVPWLSRRILDEGNLSAAWSQALQVLARPSVWQGLMLVIVVLWLGVFLSDRLHLLLCANRLRREIRREVQHYHSMANQA